MTEPIAKSTSSEILSGDSNPSSGASQAPESVERISSYAPAHEAPVLAEDVVLTINPGKARFFTFLVLGLLIASYALSRHNPQVFAYFNLALILASIKISHEDPFSRNATRYLTLSKNGIDWHFFQWKRGKIEPWSDLRLIGFRRARIEGSIKFFKKRKRDALVFDCQSGTDSYVYLDDLSEADKTKLFTLIARNVDPQKLAPEVVYLQVQQLSDNQLMQISDYTRIWEEEFNNKFGLSNHATLKPGTSCGNGRFDVTMLIGARLNSSLYLATDKRGNKLVIKELVAPVDATETARNKLLEQFNREAKTLASLNHPSIVSVVDYFVEDSRRYLVMKCVSGINLREHVRSTGTLSDAELRMVALQMAEVLQFLHEQAQPIIHRDFTPDNVVYSPEKHQITIVDFGSANVYNAEGTATLVGKQYYMPPEQFRGKPTPASDIYAFGASLLFLLTGKEPPGMARLTQSHLEGISSELQEIIKQCMIFEENERPTAVQLVKRFQPDNGSAGRGIVVDKTA